MTNKLINLLLDARRELELLNRGMSSADTPIEDVFKHFHAAYLYINAALTTISEHVRSKTPPGGPGHTTKEQKQK